MTQIARGLEADGILTGAGKTKWYDTTINKILRNEKYYGDALLQKTYTTDFLTKSRVKNDGIMPQYYVHGDHEPIVSKEMFLLVQEEIDRRKHGSYSGRASRYSNTHCLSGIVYCDRCGGLFRRVHWNNHGCKSIVWRCIDRLENMARTIREDDLEKAVVQGINRVFCQSDGFIDVLEENVRRVVGGGVSVRDGGRVGDSGAGTGCVEDGGAGSVEDSGGLTQKSMDEKIATLHHHDSSLDAEIASLQRKLIEKINKQENYEDIAEQIKELQIEKAMLESDGMNGKRNAKMMRDIQDIQDIQDMYDFIRSQGSEITEFDEKIVRRLVERVTVSDEKVTVVFKSGQRVEV